MHACICEDMTRCTGLLGLALEYARPSLSVNSQVGRLCMYVLRLLTH